jgi:replication-associated recombination protein RarA
MGSLFETHADSAQQGIAFPQSLTEEFRPKRIAEFVGLEKQKKILGNLLHAPRPCALLFLGAPGTGKTTLAMAFASELNADFQHIGSQQCKLDELERVVRMCHYVPKSGLAGFHVVLVDESDVMSDAAQKYLLSKLDATEACPNTIWIFTCNATDRLEERFLSRCLKLDFNSYGSGSEIAELLARIWKAKAGNAPAPNLKRLACGNVRESLQRLEVELLAV